MSARELINDYGLIPAGRLALRIGGWCIYMPRTPGRAPRVLREELGYAAAERLRKKHAGAKMYVPQLVAVNDLIEWSIVRRLVRQLIREGHANRAIARVLKISPGTVRNVRTRMSKGAVST